MSETRFLPPLIVSKWRGLRGLDERDEEEHAEEALVCGALPGAGQRVPHATYSRNSLEGGKSGISTPSSVLIAPSVVETVAVPL